MDKMMRYRALMLAAIVVFAASMFAFGLALRAHGRDLTGKWAQADPALKQWFSGLESKQGANCCSSADGIRIDDAEWKRSDKPGFPFQVVIDGEWRDVPENSVVQGPNKVGYAMVWPVYAYRADGKLYFSGMRCFLPGTEG